VLGARACRSLAGRAVNRERGKKAPGRLGMCRALYFRKSVRVRHLICFVCLFVGRFRRAKEVLDQPLGPLGFFAVTCALLSLRNYAKQCSMHKWCQCSRACTRYRRRRMARETAVLLLLYLVEELLLEPPLLCAFSSLRTLQLPRIKNKTAIITGASRGIGAQIALELASRGANVAVGFVSDSSRSKAEEIV
jgi:hypothetical protein